MSFPIEKLTINNLVDIASISIDPSVTGYTAPIGSAALRDTGELWLKVGATDTDWEKVRSGTIIGVDQFASTGLLDGGELSINGGDNTKFDVAAGIGLIVDNYTDTLNPTAQVVTWSASTAVTVTNLATSTRSFIAINSSGAIVQSPEPGWSNQEHKENIVLGNLGHANFTTLVGLRNNPDPAIDATARLADLARAIGSFNVSGNVFSPNGNTLQVNKSSGTTYRLGNNFANNKKDTDTNTDNSQTNVPFIYSYQDGVGGHTLVTPATTAIDSNFYDDGSGTLAAMPNGRWQVQIIKYFSGIAGAATTRIEYGQQTFSTKAAALDVLPDANHIHNPAFAEGVIRCYLVLSANATDLSDPSQAEFIEAAKFGQGGGGQFSGSVTTLQQAYSNSTDPEITTDATRGGINIKEGLGVGGNLITGQDDASTIVFNVDVAGNLTATILDQISNVNTTTKNTNDVLTWTGTEWVAAAPPGAGGGESNTASNIGVGGVGVFDQKIGVDLQFRNINTGSTKVTVTDDAANNEIDIDIVEGQIVHQNLNGAGTNTHAQIDAHIADGSIHTPDQNLWATITSDAGSTTANTTTDTLTVTGGTGISTAITGDTLTITNDSPNIAQNVFDQFTVTDTDAGYTWAATGTASADTTADTLTLVSGNGIDIDVDAALDAIRITNTLPNIVQNVFTNIAVSGQNTVIADTATDTLTLVAGSGMTITTDDTTDTITLAAVTPTLAINDLTDVVITGATNGEVLTYNGANWVNQPAGAGADRLVAVSAADTTSGYLDQEITVGTGLAKAIQNPGANENLQLSLNAVINDITNVNTVTPIDGDVLAYDQTAGEWYNTQLFVPGAKKTIQANFGTIGQFSGTTVIPYSATAPLITEGTQIWTASFTPVNSASEIKITTSLAFSVTNASSQVVVAIFRDNTCIGVMSDGAANGNSYQTVSFTIKDPGPVVGGQAYTYSARIGKTGGNATWYVNNDSGGNNFGSVLSNNAYTIEEVVIL